MYDMINHAPLFYFCSILFFNYLSGFEMTFYDVMMNGQLDGI
jgi:hypothetical protein